MSALTMVVAMEALGIIVVMAMLVTPAEIGQLLSPGFGRIVSFFFSSRRRHTRFDCDWSSDVCSSDLSGAAGVRAEGGGVSPAASFLVPSSWLDPCSNESSGICQKTGGADPWNEKRARKIGRASCRERV